MSIMQLTQTIQIVPPSKRSYQKNGSASQPTLPGLGEPRERKEPQAVPTNRQIADVLNSIANVLDSQRGNPYRVQAYRNAANGIMELQEPAAFLIARGERLPVPGLGRRLQARIKELVLTGTMTFYHDLCLQSLPAAVRSLMAIEHIGPHVAARLYEELGIDTPEKLWQAAQQHEIRQLYGFGPRSEARLKAAAESLLKRGQERAFNGAA